MHIMKHVQRCKRFAAPVSAHMVALVYILLALPMTARADDDEKPMPIDPKTAAAQNLTLAIIFGLVCLVIAWYYLRRWQITRNGRQVHGEDRNQD